MHADLDFVFRLIPRFMTAHEAMHEWGKFDLYDLRLCHHCLDVEAENQARYYASLREK